MAALLRAIGDGRGRPLTRPPLRVEVAYALPAFALAVVGIPVYVYLPRFYTDTVGVSIGVVGGVILAARLFDALSDPALGALSDRTRSRWGRRRPWILGGAPVLALAIGLLFVPPPTGSEFMAWWFAGSLFLLFLAWTAITIPYESLGLELCDDYDGRTRLLGLRDSLLIAGTLAAAAAPAMVAAALGLPEGDHQRQVFRTLAWVYGPLVLGSCALCAWVAPERPPSAAPGRFTPLASLHSLRRNRPFAILLAAYAIGAFGGNLPATLIEFYVRYVLGSSRTGLFLALYFATGIVFLPGWIALSRKTHKKAAWLGAMAVNTGAFVGVLFLGPGDELAYGILVALSGVGFGATLAIPSSMQADVADYDEYLCGRRREGELLGAWSVSKKLAAALGVGLALPMLGWVGYVPNVEQTPAVRQALTWLYAGVPCLCNLLGAAFVLAYPIDRAAHARILSALESVRAGERPLDPLKRAAC